MRGASAPISRCTPSSCSRSAVSKPAPASLASPVVGCAANGARSVGVSGSIRRSSRPWRPPPGIAQPLHERVDVGERREVRGHHVQLGVGTGRRAVQVAVEAPARGRVGRGRDDDGRAAAQQPPDELDRDRAGRGAGDERDLAAQVGRGLEARAERGDQRGGDLGGRRDGRVGRAGGEAEDEVARARVVGGCVDDRARRRARSRRSGGRRPAGAPTRGDVAARDRARAPAARPRRRASVGMLGLTPSKSSLACAAGRAPLARHGSDDARQRRGDVRAALVPRRERRDRPRWRRCRGRGRRGGRSPCRARRSRGGRRGRRGRR